MTTSDLMRLAVYCDFPYRRRLGTLSAEQPFAVFLRELAAHTERLIMVGRLDDGTSPYPYAIPQADLAALPHYGSGADAIALLRSAPRTIAAFWRAVGEVDTVLCFGPTPLSLVLAGVTMLRRRRLVLGVRQDTPRLMSHRYPNRPWLQRAARILETVNRALAMRVATVVVGPDLARNYARSHRLHTAVVSLLGDEDLLGPQVDVDREAEPKLEVLSVGRLDPEKNPLLLADVLALLVAGGGNWHLHVCGDGPLADALNVRLSELGLSARATLHGHLPIDDGLLDLYRQCRAMLHVSLTEGVPQVLLEAFAMRLPVVATAVGGVPDLVGDCGLLVPARDAEAAAAALRKVLGDETLRAELLRRASERVRDHTRQREVARLAAFISA